MAGLKTTLSLAGTFTAEYLEQYGILPLALTDSALRVACAGTPGVEVLEDLRVCYSSDLELVEVEREALLEAIQRAFDSRESVLELVTDLTAGQAAGDAVSPAATDVRALANQPPVIRFVNLLIREAHEASASDIHLEATRDGLRVRLRIDGLLSDLPTPPRGLQFAIVSRVKLLAELDIASRRTPLDGRIRVRLEDRELDLRVATVPTLYGESVVIRLLDHGGRPAGLADLGMTDATRSVLERIVRRPHGIVLATGPTGSGKTTTLYAALGLRDPVGEKVITVEDPVEYHIPGVTQVPVQAETGLTFAAALRSLLRQDPDVLMVGEMRDPDTAAIAVQAAMTGHLVLSSLHTNDALSAITRLADLGVESYMIAATIEAVVAQRLVRRVCDGCRQEYRPDPSMIALLSGHPTAGLTLVRGAGCSACRDTGFRGRVGIFELLVMSEALRTALASGLDLGAMRKAAREGTYQPLRIDAWAKVQAGVTTVEEVLRVAFE